MKIFTRSEVMKKTDKPFPRSVQLASALDEAKSHLRKYVGADTGIEHIFSRADELLAIVHGLEQSNEDGPQLEMYTGFLNGTIVLLANMGAQLEIIEASSSFREHVRMPIDRLSSAIAGSIAPALRHAADVLGKHVNDVVTQARKDAASK